MMGLVIGALAAFFTASMKIGMRYADQPVLKRFTIAGLITGICALMVPEVLGLGYDSLNAALAGELALPLLIALILTKLLTTSFSISLGLPVGLIGPNLLIGACVGSAMGTLGAVFYPAAADHHSFYVLLGMGAMMGAVLNAPLAALMALMELSNTTTIIFPGMLAITIATLTTSEIFKQRSAHQTALNMMDQTLPTDPVSLALQRTGVASIMHTEVSKITAELSADAAKRLDTSKSNYFVIDGDTLRLAHRRDLIQAVNTALEEMDHETALKFIDINTLDIQTQPLTELYIQATLWEALSTMNKHEVNAVYISSKDRLQRHGIVTRKAVEAYYRTAINT
ncbi:chloride channel protein [Oceanicoccus sp. KOV_DT_Chl]|uniref:chloride channel protein n=1 Tax=Oceanicoccus sp. KOV_DT_Chl TaxID=1904639 RepID=UPI00350FEB06